MTNRERLNRTNMYDILLTISNNCDLCVIRIIGGIPANRKMVRCDRYNCCAACLADWMNEKYNGGEQNA